MVFVYIYMAVIMGLIILHIGDSIENLAWGQNKLFDL